MQGRFWCFTINNYGAEEEKCLQEQDFTSYIVYGRESGESGTPHLQGYLELPKRWRLTQLSRCSGLERAHLERRCRNASGMQAATYCKKEGDYFEKGELDKSTGQGKRSDLLQVQTAIREGMSLASIAEEYFGTFVRYHRGLEQYLNYRAEPRTWVCDVVVFWGPTGMGKSGRVFRDYPDLYCHAGDRWFDYYAGQDTVLFDDYDGSVFKLSYLLRLIDRYPMRVPVKGGFVNWRPKRIYFTSNFHPDRWYAGANPEHIAALFRRLGQIIEMTEPFVFE